MDSGSGAIGGTPDKISGGNKFDNFQLKTTPPPPDPNVIWPISGIKFYDANLNGDPTGQAGIAGWRTRTGVAPVDDTGTPNTWTTPFGLHSTVNVDDIYDPCIHLGTPAWNTTFDGFTLIGNPAFPCDFTNGADPAVAPFPYTQVQTDSQIWTLEDFTLDNLDPANSPHTYRANYQYFGFQGPEGSDGFTQPIGVYNTCEVFPSDTVQSPDPGVAPLPLWVSTSPHPYYFYVGFFKHDANYGNVCLGAAGGGLTLGYWSNKNGQLDISTQTGKYKGDLTTAAAAVLNGTGLVVPACSGNGSGQYCPGTSNPTTAYYLRCPPGSSGAGSCTTGTGAGSFYAPSSSTTYSGFRAWLLDANAVNMTYMLSAQLASMELNTHCSIVAPITCWTDAGPAGTPAVDPGAVVYAPGTQITQNDLVTIGQLERAAIWSLQNNDGFSNSPAQRNLQQAIKNALDMANNNLNFVGGDQASCAKGGSITYTGAEHCAVSLAVASSTSLIASDCSTDNGTGTCTAVKNTNITFTAQVTSQYGGFPGGSVSFYNGSTLLGTVNLVNGFCVAGTPQTCSSIATLVKALTPAGTYNITAVYNGDWTYGGSTSNTLSEVITTH